MSKFVAKQIQTATWCQSVEIRTIFVKSIWKSYKLWQKLGIWSNFIKNICKCGLKLSQFSAVPVLATGKKFWNSDLLYVGKALFIWKSPMFVYEKALMYMLELIWWSFFTFCWWMSAIRCNYQVYIGLSRHLIWSLYVSKCPIDYNELVKTFRPFFGFDGVYNIHFATETIPLRMI